MKVKELKEILSKLGKDFDELPVNIAVEEGIKDEDGNFDPKNYFNHEVLDVDYDFGFSESEQFVVLLWQKSKDQID